MAEKTKIQWCHHTFNPWIGCTRVAKGCVHCYAEEMMANRYHKVRWGPQGTRMMTKTWGDPPRWNREAGEAGETRKVFCASLADVFEDFKGPVTVGLNKKLLWVDRRGRLDEAEASGFDPYRMATLDDLRRRLFALIDRCPNLNFLLLTKRPENIGRMWEGELPRENVWLGTSIADQGDADNFIDRLLPHRHLCRYLFLSQEPQVGPIDLAPYLFPEPLLDWVIVGGESRQGREDPRPFHLEWARKTLSQCRAAAVPCFVKQFGSRVFEDGRPLSFRDSHGGDMTEWPEDLRVRECPETFYPEPALS
jgi:protein gp37